MSSLICLPIKTSLSLQSYKKNNSNEHEGYIVFRGWNSQPSFRYNEDDRKETPISHHS